MDERFRRAGAILGDAAMKKLSESRVAVLGLGGVGSWCAEALCRSRNARRQGKGRREYFMYSQGL